MLASPAVALVIGDAPTAAHIDQRCREKGLAIAHAPTPLNAIYSLLAMGDQVKVVVVSETARWARGLLELVAEEFPGVKRVCVAA